MNHSVVDCPALDRAKVVIADDHPMFRDALRQLVEEIFTEHETIEADNLEAAKQAVEDDQDVDLVLLDIRMPGADGYSGLVELRNVAPATPIIMVSGDADANSVEKALKYGAAGFIPKSMSRERMAEAVRTVMSGDVYVPDDVDIKAVASAPGHSGRTENREKVQSLTAAESRVFELLADGKQNKIIAYELDIKESTVKAHISAILRKFKVHSRTQAILMARDIDYRN